MKSVLFSKTCEYALQAMIYIARNKSDKPILLEDISQDMQIPRHYLSKVLAPLSRSGLIESKKGVYGGILLGKPPELIRLMDVIRAVDGDQFIEKCIIGFPVCDDENPCPLHDIWRGCKTHLIHEFRNKSLAQIDESFPHNIKQVIENGLKQKAS